MNKAEFIDALSARLGDKRAAAQALDAVLTEIQNIVTKGEKVAITGFGVFEKKVRAARTARNPRTGEAVKVKKTSVPAFRPGAGFKTLVAKGKVQKAAAKKTVTKAATKTATTTATTAPAKTAAAKTATKAATKTATTRAAATNTATKTAAAKATKAAPAKKTTAKSTTAAAAPAARKTTTAPTGKQAAPTGKKATPARTSLAGGACPRSSPARSARCCRGAGSRTFGDGRVHRLGLDVGGQISGPTTLAVRSRHDGLFPWSPSPSAPTVCATTRRSADTLMVIRWRILAVRESRWRMP